MLCSSLIFQPKKNTQKCFRFCFLCAANKTATNARARRKCKIYFGGIRFIKEQITKTKNSLARSQKHKQAAMTMTNNTHDNNDDDCSHAVLYKVFVFFAFCILLEMCSSFCFDLEQSAKSKAFSSTTLTKCLKSLG